MIRAVFVKWLWLTGLFLFLLTDDLAAQERIKATVVTKLQNRSANSFYNSNKQPLLPGFFSKLPVTAFKPGGWLRRQLELQRDGLTGHLGEISIWLSKKENAWLSKEGKGKYGWEELPYWLKGYANIGYMLGDREIIKEAEFWINAVLNNQRESGDFGPAVLRNGNRDLWTNMPMLWCLQSYYEYSHDPRVLTFMSRYFKWELSIPDEHFLKDYWENSRGGDNLLSVYWLYNHTAEKWLLDLAVKIDRNTADWRGKDKLPNWHNVNIAQCFREPATFYQQSHLPSDLDATYTDFKLVREKFGQVPGGMFGADENARTGYDDPRQAVETCGMVEQMTSDQLLLRYTGDTYWAENCEDVAFNNFPAAFMPDYRSLRYLTAPNMVVSDSKDHSPGINNAGPFLTMNPFSSRCCQHNHAAGWVYYAENCWMATPDNGLAAQFYAEGTISARVGEGIKLSITENTRYPFEEEVAFTIHTPRKINFPLYLRLPSWCAKPSVLVNGKAVAVALTPGEYVKLEKIWQNGDRIRLSLPMEIKVRQWKNNKNSVSINFGPLTFSEKIAEEYIQKDSKETAIGDSKWQDNADVKKWPSYEIYPASPWNFGLVLTNQDSLRNLFTVIKKPWPSDNNPFVNASAPIEIRAKGKQILSWKADQYGLCSILPQSPVMTDSPVTELTLVPMGGARLRITAFPVVSVFPGVKNDTARKGNVVVNPLLPSGPDPYSFYKGGFYYYTHTMGDRLVLWKTKSLADLRTASARTIFVPPAGTAYSKDLWAPEVLFIDGKWYAYFAADNGDNKNHRLYVLENAATDPMEGDWVFKGKISDSSDKWAIDGDVFRYKGQLYMLWSGWEGDRNGQQNIYIAKMKDPLTIEGQRKLISSPSFPWEKLGDIHNSHDAQDPSHIDVNEGPQALQHNGHLFVVYSASACWTDTYALGLLTFTGGDDLLVAAKWNKTPEPVFHQSEENKVFATGHNSFFTSPDGKENWILYHANSQPGQGCGNTRSPRAQPFTWNADGTPSFGLPAKEGTLQTGAGKNLQNPVLDASFADPTLIRAEGKYFVYATQGMVKGKLCNVQVAMSNDLQHWEQIGDALPQKPVWAAHTQDFWAPHVLFDSMIRKYVLFFCAKSDDTVTDKCIGVAFADKPAGPFVDKGSPLIAGKGFRNIDPMAFTDPVSGKKLLYWGSDFQPINVQELEDDWKNFKRGSTAIPVVWPGKEIQYSRLIEGAWMDFQQEKYFLYFSGDNCCGSGANYAVMVARADNPLGPFTRFGEVNKSGSSVILKKNGLWIAPGHNSILHDADGCVWMAYHAIPLKNGKRVSGEEKRVLCINRIEYRDGWPMVIKDSNGN